MPKLIIVSILTPQVISFSRELSFARYPYVFYTGGRPRAISCESMPTTSTNGPHKKRRESLFETQVCYVW